MSRSAIAALLSLLALPSAAPAATPPSDPDARAAAVEAQMTDDERFQLLHSVVTVSYPPYVESPYKDVKAMAGYVPGIPRLGIPAQTMTDASLGVTNPLQLRPGDVATALPSGLAIAATFDPELARRAAAMVGREARAKAFNVLLAPGINLTRDPRNGRNFEYLGEDPLLTGIMGGAAVQGIQSQRVVSAIKHFALNDQETQRFTLDAVIDEAGLRESDLLAFEIAIERGKPGSVMCAYNHVNGTPACGSDFLLNQVLKRDWRYPGWVMSDWGPIRDDYVSGGLDQQAGANMDSQIWFDGPLRERLADGRTSRNRISDMVRRILRSLYAVGVDPTASESPIDYPAHAKVAREVAENGIVILKNDGALPLAADARSILVIGGHADIGVLSGAGSSQVTPVGGPAAIIPVGGPLPMGLLARQLYMPSSPLRALQAALPKAAIQYDSGHQPEAAAAAAAGADVVILFATHWQSEGFDAGSMTLPQGQDRLIDMVARANPNVIVVLETGNPVTMPWLNTVKAVVEAWYPGQEGGRAIADVLTGAVNPSGRLPMTFPVSERQNPRPEIPGLGAAPGKNVTVPYSEGSDVGYRWFAARGEKPQFPFGHGLGYTRFEHGRLRIKAGAEITASFTVTNSGPRSGADVPQIYLVEAAGRKLQRLGGFAKVRLKPGETSKVTVTLEPRVIADWVNGAWQIEAGAYRFALGKSADELGPSVMVNLKSRRWGSDGAAARNMTR